MAHPFDIVPDTSGKSTGIFQGAVDDIRERRATEQRRRANLSAALSAGLRKTSQRGNMDEILAAGMRDAEPVQDQRRKPWDLLGRTTDYISGKWQEIVRGKGPGDTRLHPTERLGSAIGIVTDALDFGAGGFATAFTANPQGGIVKWGLLKPLNAVGAVVGETGRQILASQWEGGKPIDFGGIVQQGIRGFKEEVSGTNFITEILKGHPSARRWIEEGGDAWTKWADFGAGLVVGPKGAAPLVPLFRVGGKAVRLGLDTTARGFDTLAGRFEPGTVARQRVESFSTGFKQLTDSTPEFRASQKITHEEIQAFSAAEQQLARVSNIIKGIGRKFRNDPSVKMFGDLLEHHPDPQIRAGATNKGYLPTQILLHGAEAGSDGAFFNHPAQVLDIAADLNLPVSKLAQAIDEYKALSEEAGRQMVDSGLMSDETFARNAGYWVRRVYRTNIADEGARAALIKEMVDKGVDTTRANRLVMALQNTGVSGPPGTIGAGLKAKGNLAKQHQRKLDDAAERLEFLPDYNAIDTVAGALMGQFKAAAIHRVFSRLAGDEALSAANVIKNHALGRKLDFSITPRIKNMADEVGEKIKRHQERMTEKIEKQYNSRYKWVQDQDEAVRRVEHAWQTHHTNRPIRPAAAPDQPLRPRDPKIVIREKEWQAYDEAQQQYVKELADWQRRNQAWKKRADALTEQLREKRAELFRRERFLEETDAEIARWFDEAEVLERRADLLRGAEPTSLHANDSLSAVEQRLGFAVEDPAVRQIWLDAWKEAWQTTGNDIFSDLNEIPPTLPKGVDPKLATALDQNLFPAIALDDSLSAPGRAYSYDTAPPGWTPWRDEGNRSYGAMNGRWGPEVVRRFLEDAIDPNRFDKAIAGTPMGGLFKWVQVLTNTFKGAKLYYNPGTRLGISVNSFWEAKAAVNAAGHRFNPKAYIRGMREYKAWANGDGPVTPAVEAMLGGVREAGAGFATAMAPGESITWGQEGKLGRIHEGAKQKFIEVQQFPKAGTAAVLIDAGMKPAEAGALAEQAFGARGGMGGIETHGVMQIAEGLNKYGIAIFTSYPLHSINRFFQLMAHRPDTLMTYPVIRQYLLNLEDQGERDRDARGEVRGTMIPIHSLKNKAGDPAWVDVRNIIPHGGASEEMQLGGLLSPFLRARQRAEFIQGQGAAPDTVSDEAMRQGYFALTPSVVGSGADALLRAGQGLSSHPRDITPDTPLTALGRLAGFPVTYPESSTDRALGLERETIPGRSDFTDLYVERIRENKERPKDYSSHLKEFDLSKMMIAQQSAQRYLYQLHGDKSIDEDRAKTMIRRQIDWIISINARIEELYSSYALQQQEEQNASEFEQYSEAGQGAGF